jgi:hypothetical protein
VLNVCTYTWIYLTIGIIHFSYGVFTRNTWWPISRVALKTIKCEELNKLYYISFVRAPTGFITAHSYVLCSRNMARGLQAYRGKLQPTAARNKSVVPYCQTTGVASPQLFIDVLDEKEWIIQTNNRDLSPVCLVILKYNTWNNYPLRLICVCYKAFVLPHNNKNNNNNNKKTNWEKLERNYYY